MTRHKRILAAFILLAPLGWLLFYVVFRSVPGQDWVVFHTAAMLARAGDDATLMDPAAFTAAMNRMHASASFQAITVLHPWVYPPITLLAAYPFGFLPYLPSLLAFLAVTLAALLGALWLWSANAKDYAWLVFLVLFCPATAFQLGAGQLTFLLLACVLAGLHFLEIRPFLAGLAFSVLTMKPHYALLLPVALIAGRHWRAIAGAVMGGMVLTGASLALFGAGLWRRWLFLATGQDATLALVTRVVRAYDQGLHTCLTTLGASDQIAGAATVVAFLAGAACVATAFAGRWEKRRRAIVLLVALVAASPHVGNYDELFVATAVALMLLDPVPRPRGEIMLAAAAWIAPALNPPALFAVLKSPVITAASAMTGFLPLALLVSEMAWREVRTEHKIIVAE